MADGTAGNPYEQLDVLLQRAVEVTAGLDPSSFEPVLPPGPYATADAAVAGPATRDELRRLTIMFSDLVGSTSLSGRLDPETYRGVLSTYKATCRRVIEDEFDGHLVHTRGDGMLAVFGYPTAHEDDAARAVRAALAIHDELATASAEVRDRSGEDLAARIGIHRGLVYLERDTEELYGLAVNIAARVQEAAEPGTVAITEEVRGLVAGDLLTAPLAAREMKGVERAPALHRVVGEQQRAVVEHRRWPTPLVGREVELGSLRERRSEAEAASRPLPTVVLGDAGVGKSRLVGAFLDEAPRGTPVLELRGSPFHRHQGLHPVREALCSWAGIRRDRPGVEQLAALRAHLAGQGLEERLPLLAPVAGIGPEAGYAAAEVEVGRLEVMIGDAVHELLASWFGDRSGLVLVEDLQWLDDATRAALVRFVGSGPAGVMVLATSRDELTLGPGTEQLVLEPLDAAACADLVRLHDPELADDVAAEVVHRSDGIPLFVEELVRARLDAPTPALADDPVTVDVPAALYEPLSARLGTLGDSRLVASAAATIGRTAHLDLLARVSGVTTDDLDRAVTELMDRHVLEPDHGDGRAVRFRHELVRLVAYELEPPSGRQRFHAIAADALASGDLADGADWARISEHHRLGGDPTAAAGALHRAADDARLRGALDEARRHFDRAIDLLVEVDGGWPRDALEVRLRLARSFISVSTEGFGSEPAAHDFLRGLELSIDRPESAELYQALIATWGHWVNRADLQRAWDTSTALRPLSFGNRLHMLPTNEAGFGMIELYRANLGEAVRRLGEAVARIPDVVADAATVPDAWTMAVDPIASMHAMYGVALAWTGDLAGAEEQHAAARARCAALSFPMGPFTDAYVLLLRCLAAAHCGEVEESAECADASAAISVERGFDAWLFWASILQATRAGASADADEVSAVVAQAAMSADLLHAMGVRLFSAAMRTVLADLALAAGHRELATSTADAALALSAETGATMSDLESLRIRAVAGPDADREADLLAVLERAEREGASITAVRAATALVQLAGPSHRDRLADALAAVTSDTAAGSPVLAAARAALG